MPFEKLRRIQALGQSQHPQVHVLDQEAGQGPLGSLLAGLVSVVDQHHLLGKPLECRHVLVGQSRTQSANHVVDSVLVSRHAVGVTLDHHRRLLAADRVTGHCQPIKQALLGEHRVF